MATPVKRSLSRAFWLRQLHQWHWISSAISLAALLLFAITGITLNHSSRISATPEVTSIEKSLPMSLVAGPTSGAAPLPDALSAWIAKELDVDARARNAEWSEDEIYVSLPRPGGDAWLSIDRATGLVQYETTWRGGVSYLNDLHKGRNTGPVWRAFIDAAAVACVVFAVTGLLLLKMHAPHRPSTWPLVGLGIAVVLGAIVFIH